MFFGLEAVFYWPKFFYIFLFFGAIFIALILKSIFKINWNKKILTNKKFLYFTLLLLTFFFGVLSSLLFVKHGSLFYIIAIFSSILLFGFLHTLQKHKKIADNENFFLKIVLFNLVSLFFAISSICGFIIFFRIPFWYLVPMVFLISVFLTIQAFFTTDKLVSFFDRRVLVIGLLLAQFFVILNYLPVTFFTSGLFLTVFYGLCLMFVLPLFYECQEKRCRIYQIIIGGLVLLISLLALRV